MFDLMASLLGKVTHPLGVDQGSMGRELRPSPYRSERYVPLVTERHG